MKIYFAILLLAVAVLTTSCGSFEPFSAIEGFCSDMGSEIKGIGDDTPFNLFRRSIGLICSIVCVVFSYRIYSKHRRLKYNGIETKGIVKRIDTTSLGRDEDGTKQYRYEIFIDFTDQRGKIHHISETHSGSSKSYKEGDKVSIRYNRNDPSDYMIGSPGVKLFAAIFLFIVGLIIIVFFVLKGIDG